MRRSVMYGVSLVVAGFALVCTPAMGCVWDSCGPPNPFSRPVDPTPRLLESVDQAMQTYDVMLEGGLLSITLERRAQETAWALELISSVYACDPPVPSVGFDATLEMVWTPDEGEPWTLTSFPLDGTYLDWGELNAFGEVGNINVSLQLTESATGEFSLSQFQARDMARDVTYPTSSVP